MTTRRLLPVALALALVLTSGCSLFGLKSKKPKENKATASEVANDFKTRWLDKRVGELAAQGVAPEAARVRAEEEFAQSFPYLSSAKK